MYSNWWLPLHGKEEWINSFNHPSMPAFARLANVILPSTPLTSSEFAISVGNFFPSVIYPSDKWGKTIQCQGMSA